MFRGVNVVNVDVKGRLAIPTRYRGQLQSDTGFDLIATIDPVASCLLLYPFAEWAKIEEKMTKLSGFNPATRSMQRLLLGHATELDMDAQGRILLPSLLREHGVLNRSAALIGQGHKFEIWDDAEWRKQRQSWLEAARSQENMPQELDFISL